MLENIIDYINYFFLIYIFVYAIIFFVATLSSMIYINDNIFKRVYSNNIKLKKLENCLPISLLIPAYNEELTIINCIESAINLDYKRYEIIIINDGSTDDTSQLVIKTYGLIKISRDYEFLVPSSEANQIYFGCYKGINITLVDKKNSGKADSLNVGINLATYDYVSCIDADSILRKDALHEIANPFLIDDTTVAVGGNIRISNNIKIKAGEVQKVYSPKNIYVIFQMIEYCRVFLTTRVWLNKFNGNLIISGAFGLFKKKSIVNVGGYNPTSIGEDMDLVIKLHSFYRKNELPYKIQYVAEAICYSQVPNDFKSLKSQRVRWHMGLMSSLYSHRYIFLNPSYGIVGVFSFLYFFIYEFASCVIELVGVATIVASYTFGFINREFFITFFIIYVVYNSIISIASIMLEGYLFSGIIPFGVKLKLIIFSILESFGFRQLCSCFRLIGIMKYSPTKHKWGSIKRQKHR